MANLSIEERVIHYFLAMGAQQTESAQIPHSNLAFVSGSEKIFVLILKNEEVMERNRMIETTLSLASLQGSSQLLYLAAPRLLGASVDASIFRSHGIGILLFDERRIDEALTARPQESRRTEQEAPPNAPAEVVAELVALKSMYAQMERNVANLREDLEALQQRTDKSPRPSAPVVPSRVVSPSSAFVSPHDSISSLPPFFVNNPWLDVLSKRGRAGTEPIAG